MSSSKDSFDTLADIFNDPESQQILQSNTPEEKQEAKASDEVPSILREQARRLTTEPFTGNPPHHGLSVEEALNTALIRQFSGISYDRISNDLVKETDSDELSKLLSALETFDVAEYEEKRAAKKLAEQKAKASNNAAQQSDQTTLELDSTSPIQPALTSETLAKDEPEQKPIAKADEGLSLSPSLFLMESNLTNSQHILYSTINDFISLNHRLPKLNAADDAEASVAIYLKALYREQPLACSKLLNYFIGVMPADDVELIRTKYSGDDTRPNDEVAESNASPQHSATSTQIKAQPAKVAPVSALNPAFNEKDGAQIKAQTDTAVPLSAGKPAFNKENGAQITAKPSTVAPISALNPASTAAEELGRTKDAGAQIKAQPAKVAPVSALNPAFNEKDGAQIKAQTDTAAPISALNPASTAAEELGRTKDAVPYTEAQSTTEEPVISWEMEQAFKEAQELGLTSEVEQSVKLKPKTYKASPNTLRSSYAVGQIDHFYHCSNFVQYTWIFKEIKQGLKQIPDADGEKSSILGLAQITEKCASQKVNVGDIFYIKGIFYLIADVNIGQTYETNHDRDHDRILVITDNGKQSTSFDSLFAVKFDKENTLQVHACNVQGMQLLLNIKNYCLELIRDKPIKGYVYVLRTKSQNPVLLEYMEHSELLKIGFSTQSIAKRIANAANETTFLEAPVEVLYYVECYNYNPHTFERLIHQVLRKRRLNIKLKSLVTGKVYQPKEWFTISFEVAREVIDRIMDGTIFDYYLNPVNGRLMLGSQNS